MNFFELIPWVLLGAAALGAAFSIGFVARSLKQEEPVPQADFDCRDTALITSGEGVRRDC
ncbi:MAG: hypothetical protein IPP14_12950 [Planctomycetes bacterium]|nr:hypothetical protein [Planctomycetota bacterium]